MVLKRWKLQRNYLERWNIESRGGNLRSLEEEEEKKKESLFRQIESVFPAHHGDFLSLEFRTKPSNVRI